MKRTLTTVALAAALSITYTAAQAEGCTKGAVVGGVTGHVAGDHGVGRRHRGLCNRPSRSKEEGQGSERGSRRQPACGQMTYK